MSNEISQNFILDFHNYSEELLLILYTINIFVRKISGAIARAKYVCK